MMEGPPLAEGDRLTSGMKHLSLRHLSEKDARGENKGLHFVPNACLYAGLGAARAGGGSVPPGFNPLVRYRLSAP